MAVRNINFTAIDQKFWVYLKTDQGGADSSTTHRVAGLEFTSVTTPTGDDNIKIQKRVYNGGNTIGTTKHVGHLGNANAWVYNSAINIGITVDYTNQTFEFWVGSPGENPTAPFGMGWANAANQSTSVAALTNQIISDLQFNTVLTNGSSIEDLI
jgi:hypothetical protein